MRLIDRLGIDLNTVEGLTTVMDLPVYSLPCRTCNNQRCTAKCQAEHLLAEVPMHKVKRWETYNGNFTKAVKDFNNLDCGVKRCEELRYNCDECFADWLMDEIEV